jgi:hypothetical protein
MLNKDGAYLLLQGPQQLVLLLQNLRQLLSGWGNARIQLLQVSHQLGTRQDGRILKATLAEGLLVLLKTALLVQCLLH